MDTGLWVALFGLLGTMVGGTIQVLPSVLGASRERRKELVARADRWRDQRLEVCVAFALQVDQFNESQRAYVAAIESPQATDDVEVLRAEYLTAWKTLASDLARVQIANTEEVSRLAGTTYNAVADFSELADTVVRGGKWGKKHDDARKSMFDARRAFISAARSELTPQLVGG